MGKCLFVAVGEGAAGGEITRLERDGGGNGLWPEACGEDSCGCSWLFIEAGADDWECFVGCPIEEDREGDILRAGGAGGGEGLRTGGDAEEIGPITGLLLSIAPFWGNPNEFWPKIVAYFLRFSIATTSSRIRLRCSKVYAWGVVSSSSNSLVPFVSCSDIESTKEFIWYGFFGSWGKLGLKLNCQSEFNQWPLASTVGQALQLKGTSRVDRKREQFIPMSKLLVPLLPLHSTTHGMLSAPTLFTTSKFRQNLNKPWERETRKLANMPAHKRHKNYKGGHVWMERAKKRASQINLNKERESWKYESSYEISTVRSWRGGYPFRRKTGPKTITRSGSGKSPKPERNEQQDMCKDEFIEHTDSLRWNE